MALAKRSVRERNQRRRKILRMSKTERSTPPEEDRWNLPPSFTAGRSGPLDLRGGARDEGTACGGAGEGMDSFAENMVVREQEGMHVTVSVARTALRCWLDR